MTYVELEIPPRPDVTWPPTPEYQAALTRASEALRNAAPWTLATMPGEAMLVARRRTWWMRVVTWWLNRHLRPYVRWLGAVKAERIERARTTPNRNGG